MSSPLRRFTIVVFPALSRPLRERAGAAGDGRGARGGPGGRRRRRGGGREVGRAHAGCRRRIGRGARLAGGGGGGAARRGGGGERARASSAPQTYTMSSRISFSFCLTFLMMVSSPMAAAAGGPRAPAPGWLAERATTKARLCQRVLLPRCARVMTCARLLRRRWAAVWRANRGCCCCVRVCARGRARVGGGEAWAAAPPPPYPCEEPTSSMPAGRPPTHTHTPAHPCGGSASRTGGPRRRCADKANEHTQEEKEQTQNKAKQLARPLHEAPMAAGRRVGRPWTRR